MTGVISTRPASAQTHAVVQLYPSRPLPCPSIQAMVRRLQQLAETFVWTIAQPVCRG